MSRTPIAGKAATDRDVQSLMKIKRRVMFDENRPQDDKNKIDRLLIELMAFLHKPYTAAPEVAVVAEAKPTSGKLKQAKA